MPIYEYTCNDCKEELELLIRQNEKPVCEKCGSKKLTKLLSVAAAHSASAASSPPSCNSPGGMCGMGGCGM